MIDAQSEHFADQEVYIIDVMDDEEYTYCVARSRTSIDTSGCEWVKGEHVHSPRVIDRPVRCGDIVVIEDNDFQSVLPTTGWAADVSDPHRIGVAARPDGEITLWVSRKFIRHAF